MAVTAVSELNPIHWWLTPPVAIGSVDPVLDLCSLKVTFNTEDKNDAIPAIEPYYHKVSKSDELYNEIIVDDTTHNYSILAFNEDGSFIDSYALVRIGATSHYAYTLSSIDLTALRDLTTDRGKYVSFAIIDDTEDILYAVSDIHLITDSITKKTTILRYQSIREFLGVLPDTLISIRIPGVLFQPETTEGIETQSTSAGSVTALTGEVSTSIRFKTDKLPKYFDRKLKLILKSHVLQSGSKTYKQRDPMVWTYFKENYEFGFLNGLLYEQNSTTRNVYATPPA